MIQKKPWTKKRLVALRARLGLTQVQLALLLGLHPSTTAHWECEMTAPSTVMGIVLGLLEQGRVTVAQVEGLE